jgi:type II secretory pathway component PulF
MHRFARITALLFSCSIFAALLVLMFVALGIGYGSFLVLLVLGATYGWMLFAFWHYRGCRQEEFVQVLVAAAEGQAPLAPALWAYLRDRPSGTLREAWLALLLFFVVPGYYWIWYGRSSYDRKVEQVALLLEDGYSLSEALDMTPGVASRTIRLAVALGEDTGQLALCLRAFRSPARSRLSTFWLEMVPRFAYPLVLLLVINGVLTFWLIYIVPKINRIFQDFRMTLPIETRRAMALGDLAIASSWFLGLAIPVLVTLFVLVLVSPGFRWYFPIVGGLYRRYVRSQMLQALAVLLQIGRPAPEALGQLAARGGLVGGARRNLEAVRWRVAQGEPLAESLCRGRVLPWAMVPLLRTAERVGNLPWALTQIADLLAERAARRVQRLGLVLFPVPVVGMGILVGVIVVGVFMPLITLIDGLTQ